MGQLVKWSLLGIVAGAYVACSPKEFTKSPDFNKCQNFNQSCVTVENKDYFDYSETVLGGKVDLLIVNDNSGSMSYEQTQLGNRFQGFINWLENRFIQYRIGMTTTDISSNSNSPRSINQNGALQDGRLVLIGGKKFLSNQDGTLSQKDAAFRQAVVRNETLNCEQFVVNWVNSHSSQPNYGRDSQAYQDLYNQNCPSGDERGIMAANLSINSGAEGMLRSDADLAVIILADEDVRSQRYYFNDPNYPLESLDSAQSFVSNVQSKFPQKTVSVHSIITGTSSCLSQQNSQTMGLFSGSYGLEYVKLSQMTGGVVGDICASDYTAQLLNIFNNLSSKIVDKVSIACSGPGDLSVQLINNSDPTITWTLVGSEIKFNKKLPVGTTVRVRYYCATL